MTYYLIKDFVTNEMLESVGFKYNPVFNVYERFYNHGYLNFTSIEKGLVQQHSVRTDFQTYDILNPKDYIEDLIEKNWVEQIRRN